MQVELVTKEEFKQGLDELEKRLRSDIRKDVVEDMRKILTEELPVILEQKFVTKDAFTNATKAMAEAVQ